MPGLFKLYPSHICSAILFFVYTLTILIVFMLPMVVLIKIALAALLACALYYSLRRDAWLLLPLSPVAIRIEGDQLRLITRGGSELQGEISGNSVVTPFITILHVVPQVIKGVRYVVIFPDSMDKERFRELRVQLKWGV
jgi:toxin CptA